MANSLNDMLQDIVNRPYEQKLLGAKATLGECFGILTSKGADQQKATVVVLTFLAAAIAVDGQFSAPERRMLNDMFGNDLEGIVKSIDRKAYDLMDQFVDSLNASDKSTFCLLAV